MDTQQYDKLAKKWSHSLKIEFEDVKQEILLLLLERKNSGESFDIFLPGNEGALFDVIKWNLMGGSWKVTPSIGGSGAKKGELHSEFDDEQIIEDEYDPEAESDLLKKRFDFETLFEKELDQLDEIDNLAGSDLGNVFGFSSANGRSVNSQLKSQIIEKAKKRFSAKKMKIEKNPFPRSEVQKKEMELLQA
jgi:hypothetical protein